MITITRVGVLSVVSGALVATALSVSGGSPGLAGGGGSDCSSSSGADVIVGDLYDVTSYGSVGDIAAFSVGTYSCNIGTQPLEWISSNNRHPVISQNLYQIRDGVIRQLGQSWLKHGFFALQNNLCCPSCSGGSSDYLGVGCADPYSAGLNGSQSGLGPKFEVNPHTGYYPYPATDLNITGNSIYKRLQARHSDLEQGGQFIVEAQYIAQDDAASGNQNNNNSWRPVGISGGGANWTMSLQGETHREDPAIRAWKYYDDAVQLVDHQLQQDGMVIVGCRVFENSNGTWTYEYAAQNLNSERAVRSFTVPFSPGASVYNVGFHDVDYHSAEPFASTDWAHQVGSASVTWSTDTHASDPDANALRWGTLYNFSFTTDASPADGAVLMGLFKPGPGPDVESVPIQTPGGTIGFIDCNGNGISDYDDLAQGDSTDCNDNSVPDECESFTSGLLQLETVSSGASYPTGFATRPGDASRVYVTELGGLIRYQDDSGASGVFLDLSSRVSIGGQRGLFSMVFDPGFGTENTHLYVSYTDTAGDSVVSRFTASGPGSVPLGSELILVQVPQDGPANNGGGLAFGPDGMLYAGIGDGGLAGDLNRRSQDPQSLLGKILRLDPDDGPDFVPDDNPFVGDPGTRDEIWALGVRNPWRFSFDRTTGDLWISDPQADADDEVNLEPAGSGGGRNYGWNCYEGGAPYDLADCGASGQYVFPIFRHELAGGGCSIIGGHLYRGCANPWLTGRYLYADYCSGRVYSYDPATGLVEDHTADLGWDAGLGSIVSIGADSDGELYLVSDQGGVHQVVPEVVGPVCGNGILETGEFCDDGNDLPQDGCFNCQPETGADLCEDAYEVVVGENSFDTRSASAEFADPSDSFCQGTYLDWQQSPDVWFTFSPGLSGALTLSTCQAGSYDTSLALYRGDSCAQLEYVACNGDGSGESGCQAYYSRIANFPVTAGEIYWIRLGGYYGETGQGTLDVTFAPSGIDCDGNGLKDSLEIAEGLAPDCNGNQVPDSCDLTSGVSFDCAGGPVGEAALGEALFANNCAGCHNADGSGGAVWPGPNIRNTTRTVITEMLFAPTNHPGGTFEQFGLADIANLEAFLADGGSGGRPDGVPDGCQSAPDCDQDGVSDACELAAGTAVDLDWNGVPDACDPPACPADLNADGLVDGIDLALVLGYWGTDGVGDVNQDGVTNGADLAVLLGSWGDCGGSG
ncbi:MAG: PQQ-dependent sugar dehydrogenase [Planctomycetota bacterium]|nr:PQQ-dependent sugar dehydrogenase [Planctomycetota bacterium]